MKKVFGIILALALVLSMAVMATPVSATLTPGSVSISDDIAGASASYTITFTMDEPLVAANNDVINIMFPTGTDITAVVLADITVNTIAAGGLATVGNSLVITVGADVAPGLVTVVIANDHIVNPAPCYHTLSVGTSHETTIDIGPYKIYLFELTLVLGWNLISLPGIPEDPAIEVVLAELIALPAPFTFEVWYYDCGTWYVFNNGGYATLDEMHDGAAYWIKVSAAASFKVKGLWYPPPPGPPIKYCYHECWNMVGFTQNADMLADDYMETMTPSGSYFYILGWTAGAWVVIDPAADDFEVGQGYWISFIQDACFAPPV